MATNSIMAKRPGPKGHRLTGHLPEFMSDPLSFLSHCVREYGDLIPLRLGPIRALLVNRTDAIEEVLDTKSEMFTKPSQVRLLRPLLGNGLLVSEGEFWRQQRRLVGSAFDEARILSHGVTIIAETERLLSTWRDGEVRDIHHEMQHLATHIAGKVLFGDAMEQELDAIDESLTLATQQIEARLRRPWLPVPYRVPTPGNLRLRNAVRRLDEVLYRWIQTRRGDLVEGGDVLSLLVRKWSDDHLDVRGQQVRDEVAVLLQTGREPALALSWAWYLLAQHPDVEAELVRELESVLGDRAPTVTDLPRLVTAERIVSESLRLYPPVWLISRQAKRNCDIGEQEVLAGTVVLMSPWVMHRDRRHFDDSESFCPNRWAGDLAERLPRFAYFPFGGGPRGCVGATFTRQEVTIVLATIAQRFHVSLVSGQEIRPHPGLTLTPHLNMQVCLQARASESARLAQNVGER